MGKGEGFRDGVIDSFPGRLKSAGYSGNTHLARLMVIGLASTLLLAACGASSTAAPPAATVTITVMGYQFSNFQDNFHTKIVQPFEQSHPNVKVHYVPIQNSAAMLAQLQTQKANPQVDVVIQDLNVANTEFTQSLLQPLNPRIVTNYADLAPAAQFSGYKGAGLTLDALILMYNKLKVQTPPTSWLDMLDPKYKGQIASWATPDLEGIFLLVAIDKALGANYLVSIQPALDAIKKARANWLTWNPTPDTPPMILNNQVLLGTDYNSDAQAHAAAANSNIAVAFPSEGLVPQINVINLVQGSKYPTQAQDFINYALDPAVQAAFDTVTLYSPTNPKAAALMAPDVLAKTSAAPALQAETISLDWPYITANRDGWGTLFTKQILNQ